MKKKMLFLCLIILLVSCEKKKRTEPRPSSDETRIFSAMGTSPEEKRGPIPGPPLKVRNEATFQEKIAQAAEKQIGVTRRYDPAYSRLGYPMGDVPLEKGVCTDVVVRALRAVRIDLQEKVHEDMKKAFSAYPKMWGLKKPDPNIDHRRVPNLMVFFERSGHSLKIEKNPEGYRSGDIVAWKLGSGRLHIGIVTRKKINGREVPLIVHNIGRGAQLEDFLFEAQIIGHYRIDSP